MTTPTPQRRLRDAYGSGRTTPPSQHHTATPTTPTAVEPTRAALSKQHHTTTRRRLAALTAALHTGLRELAAVAQGGLDTLPGTQPLPKGPLVRTGLGLPDTIAGRTRRR